MRRVSLHLPGLLHRLACGLFLTLVALAAAHAQGGGSREVVRGEVSALDGQRLTLKAEDGRTVTMQLATDARLVGISRASLDSIAPGSFIGTAASPGPDGRLVAQEVHIFPEAMRGTGEGHRPYSSGPSSTMTNGTVAAVSQSRGGSTMTNGTVAQAGRDGAARRLTVKYKDGDHESEQTVVVPPNVPVVMVERGDRALLVPGAHVRVVAMRQPDGSLTAASVNVGKNGLVPPM
jgi:hypothetical protein